MDLVALALFLAMLAVFAGAVADLDINDRKRVAHARTLIKGEPRS